VLASNDDAVAAEDDTTTAEDGVFPVRDYYSSSNEEDVIANDVYTVGDLHDDGNNVCPLAITPGKPTFKSTLTLTKKGIFDDSRKKNAVWD
jgi:hypothetical protein